MKYDSFQWDLHEGIGAITFNRPEKLNALTFEVYTQLEHLTGELRPRADVKVVILRGQGRGFCSGGDVHEIIGQLLERDANRVLEFTRLTGAVVRNLRLLGQPVIAAVQGIAAGAGAVLALAADFRVMAESARIAFLFTKVGLTGADMGAAYLLPKVVGLGRATELLMLGDTIDARTAERYGLTSAVVADSELASAVHSLAARLANGPTLALSMTKQLLNSELNMDFLAAIESEAQAQALLLLGQDVREYYRAFTEKRSPKFKGA